MGGSFPVDFGGPEDDEDQIYTVLRNAVGEGGSAINDQGIDGLWRRCKAQGLATLQTMVERAAMQAFPHLATDHIPVYEAIARLVPGPMATDEDRRQAIVAAWTRALRADVPSLKQQLKLVDPRADVVDVPHDQSTVVVLGKAFEPQDGTPDYGPHRSTQFPNYASEFLVPVTLAVVGGVPTATDLLTMERLKRVLRDVLPSWDTFTVSAVDEAGPVIGFFLDLSQLDLTAMT
jgi:hypothetical protein